MGYLVGVLVVVVVVVAVIVASVVQAKAKRETLLARYGDEEIVRRLLARQFWQGMTTQMLTDSLGPPADVDRKVLKTKTKEIWKYGRVSARAFRLRITVENGEVVGWDQKG